MLIYEKVAENKSVMANIPCGLIFMHHRNSDNSIYTGKSKDMRLKILYIYSCPSLVLTD